MKRTVEKPPFADRADAGRQLAAKLADYIHRPVVVMAIPNGGVPAGAEIARALKADLDLVIVRKIPMPLNPESGFGAIADDGTMLVNDELARRAGLDGPHVEREAERVRAEIRRRSLLYRGSRPLVSLQGKTVIIVDDGLASGVTIMAAVASVRRRYPREIAVAAPCASVSAMEQVVKVADEVVTCAIGDPDAPFVVADYYERWVDVRDAEVLRVLDEFQAPRFHPTHYRR